MPIFRGLNGEVKQDNEEELATRQIHRNNEQYIEETIDDDDPNTRVMFKRSSSSEEEKEEDPVVGWLVIVNGKGKTNVLTLGYGMNSIGRNPDERISINFGDEEISRTQHAIITYDPRGRKFYVQHGGGKNLTYLADQPLLVPMELKGGEEILIGQTTLRFVPLCGEDFDWQQNT
jgi:hypothetical protein